MRKENCLCKKTFKITFKNGNSIIIDNLKKFAEQNGYTYANLKNAVAKKATTADILSIIKVG